MDEDLRARMREEELDCAADRGVEDAFPGSEDESTGLRVREFYAALILAGLSARATPKPPERAATIAVVLADALLRRLQGIPEQTTDTGDTK